MSTGTGSTSSSGGGKFVAPSTEALDEILDAYEFIEILGQGGMGLSEADGSTQKLRKELPGVNIQ